MDIKANVFLIGAQKSATTSVYDWMAQHPDVCGPTSMKDTPFFIDDTLYSKGYGWLSRVYESAYRGEEIVVNGCAHYMFFDSALQRISEYNPGSRLIVILRNPVDRAFSSYQFARKRNLESKPLLDAIKDESERLKSNNLKVITECTYAHHGLYYRQLTNVFKHFDRDKVLVLLYEQIKKEPLRSIKEVYGFLGVDKDFEPDLRKLNPTGSLRYPLIRDMIYNDSKAKRWFLKNILDPVLPHDRKYRLKIFFLNLITRKGGPAEKETLSPAEAEYLYSFFSEDLENLEKLLSMDLKAWKKQIV